MENKLIRPIVKIGNSSGVVLPKTWLNQKACVELIVRTSSDIFMEIIKILQKEIESNDLIGIYLVGSYARHEENQASDIDILAITSNTNKSIKKGLYEILLISKENIKKELVKNIFPLLPMLKEAEPLLNKELLKEFSNIKLTKKNIEWHIETTNYSIKENESLIKLTKELKEKNVGDSIAYSLILRLRGIYIIDCLKKDKPWSNKELIELIKKISGSDLAYERYLHTKNNATEKSSSLLPIEKAEKLLNYVKKKNTEQEKWSKELKE